MRIQLTKMHKIAQISFVEGAGQGYTSNHESKYVGNLPAEGLSEVTATPSPSNREIDHELVLLAQRGDKRAFGMLVDKYQRKLGRLLSRMTKQIAQTVNDTVASLPEELRTAITLREIEGLSYEEIASIMSCPIGTVRSRIFRARETIAVKLRPLLDTPDHKRW